MQNKWGSQDGNNRTVMIKHTGKQAHRQNLRPRASAVVGALAGRRVREVAIKLMYSVLRRERGGDKMIRPPREAALVFGQ